MKQRIATGGVIAALAIVGIAVRFVSATPAREPQAPDPVIASFERALSHEPGPVAPIRRESIEHDELYEALNRVHITGETDDEKD